MEIGAVGRCWIILPLIVAIECRNLVSFDIQYESCYTNCPRCIKVNKEQHSHDEVILAALWN